MVTLLISATSLTWTDPEGEGGPDHPGKSQVAIGFLTKSVRGSNCFSRDGRQMALC